VLLLALFALPTAGAGDSGSPAEPAEQEPFRLELPEWKPDPAGLPEELRPLNLERPALPEGVAAEARSSLAIAVTTTLAFLPRALSLRRTDAE
jgi:hypothetical protein